MFLMSVRLLKDKKEDKKSAYPFTISGEMASVEERLPYALTGAQKKVIREVYADLSGRAYHDPIDSGRRWFG